MAGERERARGGRARGERAGDRAGDPAARRGASWGAGGGAAEQQQYLRAGDLVDDFQVGVDRLRGEDVRRGRAGDRAAYRRDRGARAGLREDASAAEDIDARDLVEQQCLQRRAGGGRVAAVDRAGEGAELCTRWVACATSPPVAASW